MDIGSQTWQNGSTGAANTYLYSYDVIDRLTAGNCAVSGNSENAITYDLNGNITGLNRYLKNSQTDQLGYNYTHPGASLSGKGKSANATRGLETVIFIIIK